MRILAPAKINWTLEVLGKREDGYHEIRSVMQTIDLCDELWAEASDESRFETAAGEPLSEDDLIVRTAKALEGRVARKLPARIRVEKRIPIASGLGGGSSDAAAVLRLLDRLYELGLPAEELATVGASVGSDVPFFVYGGTALVEGRGERVVALPSVPAPWIVLVIPAVMLPDKTKRMYGAVTRDVYTDGSRTESLSQTLSQGIPVSEDSVYNSFECVAYQAFDGLERYRDVLLTHGAQEVHLVGAGPALFALAEGEASAGELAERVQPEDAKVFVVRTLGAEEATAITD
jgi:4-diphosphocytidyl-2-C-methyl-D-erythritol kinase